MAFLKPPVKPAAKQVIPPVTHKVGLKVAAKAGIAVADGFKVTDISTIDFLESGRGGGVAADPAVERLIAKAFTLEISQGIKVPVSMRTMKVIESKNGNKAELHSYKGAQTLSKRAGKTKDSENPYRFRTRRDKSGNLWLFRAEPLAEPVPVEGVEEEQAEE